MTFPEVINCYVRYNLNYGANPPKTTEVDTSDFCMKLLMFTSPNKLRGMLCLPLPAADGLDPGRRGFYTPGYLCEKCGEVILLADGLVEDVHPVADVHRAVDHPCMGPDRIGRLVHPDTPVAYVARRAVMRMMASYELAQRPGNSVAWAQWEAIIAEEINR